MVGEPSTVEHKDRVRHYEKRIHPFFGHCREGAIELLGFPCL
jgi:hypothetical protein